MAGTSRKKSGKADRVAGVADANPWALHFAAVGAVLLLGTLCYANTFDVPFVLDDVTAILTNPFVKSFEFRLKSRILGDLFFALNHRLGGLEPAGYHAVNLLLHLFNALLVYLLVQMIFRTPLLSGVTGGERGRNDLAPMAIAFGSALLFVTHPLQTQAVTYLTQRVAVMATSFYLGAVLCYGWSRLSRSPAVAAWLLGLSLLLAVAGVLTKENAVTISLAILLFEMTFFRGAPVRCRLLRLVWYLLPLVVVPLFVIGKIGFSSDLIGALSRMTAEGGAPPRMTYLLTQFPVVVSYLRLFFLPLGQNLDHDVPLRASPLDPVVIASFLLLAALAALGVRLWLSSSRAATEKGALAGLAAFGIGWLFISLSIESGSIPIRDVMFEHRMYLPSVGLVMAVNAAGWWVVKRCVGDNLILNTKWFVGFVAVVGVMLGAATYARNRVWQDEVTLWQDVVAKSPGKSRAHGSLGHAYQRSGFPDEALRCYQDAVRLAPGDHVARNNLGTIYLGRKEPEAALEQFREALKSAPSSIGANYNLGLALAALDRLGEAEAAYRTVIGHDPRNDSAFNNLGIVLFRQTRYAESEGAFREAARLNPGNESAVRNLANVRKALNPTAR